MAGNSTDFQMEELIAKPSARMASPAIHRMQVPESLELRNVLRHACRLHAEIFDLSQPLSRRELETAARQVLVEFQLPECYVGWTMVVLSNEFWRERVISIPLTRRLLLLPEVSTNGQGRQSGFADVQIQAESLGMKVLAAESSPELMQLLFDNSIEAIVGVASLDVLEKALEMILLAGIPALAVPLLSKNDATQFDSEWVEELLNVIPSNRHQHEPEYAALLRSARAMFEPAELIRLVPRLRKGPSLAEVNGAGASALEPIAATEAIAHDFLALGGKYARPFITLAAFQAMNGDTIPGTSSFRGQPQIPDAVRRVALSIEIFHKASLVHDDIEDADEFRYGRPTLHRAHGLPTAINVGDYLIGLGYSLVSRESSTLGADVVGDIVDILADAHLRLSEGQGAELLWRDARNKLLSTQDALEIYALKTSPAFEAALLSGLRCAGPLGESQSRLKEFCRHLGIAFQILNDLKDWQGDQNNKLHAGLDTLGGRPTVLWALAIAGLPETRRQELLQLVDSSLPSAERVTRVRELYTQAHVFTQADKLIADHQSHALSIADEIEPECLNRLLHYLVDTVLFGASTFGDSVSKNSYER
ncbi:polyprenyl synthetase family protein [Bythopirellula polymerisocia]|uniref:Octaprenyl-diphosphate synthase n=1 Tax=Bythopirellula polymerisocia TaxID=2528003 RepID=A0A5C6CI91_9BACT|nr:polyprenyl synthetase family protein [Bythopirellula polymerisocia]TWU23805.1 Octaprenyl-diphosphate synthase [Bythopirellula polymerisocia]